MRNFFASGRRRRLVLYVATILLTAVLVTLSTLDDSPPAEPMTEAAVE